ncbi:MAG: sigma-54-dependent Fis family transcriptional regulator [Candidatus Rokubacteria bacterium]|nr:sigma-54-dependent Fis family transcriptional regulator [Candidatus Rokubacteria bacterium]
MKQKAARVLIVDDEPDVVSNWARVLERDGYLCVTATQGERALGLLEAESPDVVLTDLQMPRVDGMAILTRALELDPDIVVVVITGHGTIQSAVEAMRAGAFDYLLKPLPSNDALRLVVERGVAKRHLVEENRRLRESLSPQVGFDKLVGESPAMLAVFDLVRKAARSEANILIQGESGTGKELIARAIHANSPRAAEVFVPVDCAALPENLLESELFGHERGAFTGADRAKPGMFEVADRGTLFLDEVGELPLGLQAKLLRALQEREIRRVGGTKLIPVDVRLVSATNRDLAESVRKREFREELFYRVNVIAITLPPLRERQGDVALLAYRFLGRYGRNREQPLEGIDADALAVLEANAWPGNIRELQNVIERACALADGPTLQLRDLPEHIRGRGRPAPALSGKELPLREAREAWLRVFTEEYLTDLLRRHGGNISQAAKTAGVDRKTLHRLLAKHGIKA